MAEPLERPAPTSCAVGCGACCDPVTLSFPLTDLTEWTSDRWRALGDPRDDAVWDAWPTLPQQFHRDAEGESLRDAVIAVWDHCQAGGPRYNADFAAKHWRTLLGPEREAWVGATRVVCDAFDRHTRTCTLHVVPVEDGGQPPICSGYPHYGGEPGSESVHYGTGMNPVCEFNREVRTFLTIVEVR